MALCQSMACLVKSELLGGRYSATSPQSNPFRRGREKLEMQDPRVDLI